MDNENGQQSPVDTNLGISRRTVLRRGAVVGGSLVWAAPAVQSISRTALAQDNGTPVDPPPPPEDCCTADAFGLRVAIPLLNILPETFGAANGSVASVDVGTMGTVGARVQANLINGNAVEQPGGPCVGTASVADINVQLQASLVSLNLSATVISTRATATCGDNCTVTGSSSIASLTLNGQSLDVSNLLGQCNVDLLGLGLVTFNRQVCNGDTLTVDAINIDVLGALQVVVARSVAQGDGCACQACA